MRVLYFSGSYGPHDLRFLSALARTKHRIFYARLDGTGSVSEGRPVPPLIEQVPWVGGERPFRWRNLLRLVRDFRRVIRETKPDLVHAGPIQTCAFLSVLSGFRPVLTMSWGFDLMQDADRNAWWRSVTRYTLARSTFFTSDAIVTRDRAIALGMDPRRTLVFPWGVDLREFAPARIQTRSAIKGRLRPPYRAGTGSARRLRMPDDLVLLCNRSWEPRYGVDVLARAFVVAAARNPRLSLILLGGGSQTQLIRTILSHPGTALHVLYAGRVPAAEVAPWYRRADVFVSPSHIDGSSVSLMEALASGLPALVSDIPANKEWIQEDVNGWLFPDGDVDSLADRILAIASTPANLGRLGKAARKTAEDKADWRRNFLVLLKAYEKTMDLN